MVGGELGTGTLVRLHIGERGRPQRPSGQDGGQPGVVDETGQRVLDMGGDQDHAVDMPLAQIRQQLVARALVVGQHQHHLDPGGAQHLQQAADHTAEVRVGEHPADERFGDRAPFAFGDDHGDRVGPPGHQ